MVRDCLFPLVEVVLGAVVCAQLPVELQVIILHQFAQNVQELIKADLVVLVFVSCPEQLCDVIWLPAALGNTEQINTLSIQSSRLLLLGMKEINRVWSSYKQHSGKQVLTQSSNDKVTSHYKVRLKGHGCWGTPWGTGSRVTWDQKWPFQRRAFNSGNAPSILESPEPLRIQSVAILSSQQLCKLS